LSFLDEAEGISLFKGKFLLLPCLMSFEEALKLLPVEENSSFEFLASGATLFVLVRGFALISFSESFFDIPLSKVLPF